MILGTGARGFEDEGGAEPTVRPGWEKGSEVLDSLPQSAPMAGGGGWWGGGLGWRGRR